jgi:hypothetical protein
VLKNSADLRARAFSDNAPTSVITLEKYRLEPNNPFFTPGDTTFRDSLQVRIISNTPNAEILYQLNSDSFDPDNAVKYTGPAETKRLIERLHQRVKAGEDFAELAKSFSEDPGSALNGGLLSWIDPNALVPEFREVMNATPSGELSKPFKSTYGWHILQVMGRRATDSSEEFREQQAMNLLRNRKYDEELQAWLRQIRDEAYVESKL